MWNPLTHKNTVVTSKHLLELLSATTHCQVMPKFYLGNVSRCEPKPCLGLWQDFSSTEDWVSVPRNIFWRSLICFSRRYWRVIIYDWDTLWYFKDGLPEVAHILQEDYVLLGQEIEVKNIVCCSLEHPPRQQIPFFVWGPKLRLLCSYPVTIDQTWHDLFYHIHHTYMKIISSPHCFIRSP